MNEDIDKNKIIRENTKKLRIKIGENIKKLRLERGKTQGELGKFLGISHVAISDIERGKTKLKVDTLLRIADFFGIVTKDIKFYKPEKIMNKEKLLKNYTLEELADLIIEKNEEIKRLKAKIDNIEYIGSSYIEEKFYDFYIDKEGTES
jgi:transcriptional regulator with XRE-family HTH domain